MFGKRRAIIRENTGIALEVCSKLSDNEVINKFYVKDKLKAATILLVLVETTYRDKKRIFSKDIFESVLGVYLETWLIQRTEFATEERFIKYIDENVVNKYMKYPDVSSDDIFTSMVASRNFILANEPELKNVKVIKNEGSLQKTMIDKKEQERQNLEVLNSLLDAIYQECSTRNKEIENQGKDKKDYGLNKKNPVFVNGLPACIEYLSHLHSSDGRKLKIELKKSINLIGINGHVDVYTTYYFDTNEKLGEIYICIYGLTPNQQPPVGYLYK